MPTPVGQVVRRALTLLGQLPASAMPAAEDAADMLAYFNMMKRAWFGTLIGPALIPISVHGPSVQAETGGEYLIRGEGGCTVMAPAAPVGGARFGVVDAALAWAETPLTVQPGGVLIEGGVSRLMIGETGANVRWWFRPDTGDWEREADSPSLNARIEFPDEVVARMPFMLALHVASDLGAELRPDLAAAAAEGRTALIRLYGRRGLASANRPEV